MQALEVRAEALMKLRWTEVAAGNRNSMSMETEVVPEGLWTMFWLRKCISVPAH